MHKQLYPFLLQTEFVLSWFRTGDSSVKCFGRVCRSWMAPMLRSGPGQWQQDQSLYSTWWSWVLQSQVPKMEGLELDMQQAKCIALLTQQRQIRLLVAKSIPGALYCLLIARLCPLLSTPRGGDGAKRTQRQTQRDLIPTRFCPLLSAPTNHMDQYCIPLFFPQPEEGSEAWTFRILNHSPVRIPASAPQCVT